MQTQILTRVVAEKVIAERIQPAVERHMQALGRDGFYLVVMNPSPRARFTPFTAELQDVDTMDAWRASFESAILTEAVFGDSGQNALFQNIAKAKAFAMWMETSHITDRVVFSRDVMSNNLGGLPVKGMTVHSGGVNYFGQIVCGSGLPPSEDEWIAVMTASAMLAECSTWVYNQRKGNPAANWFEVFDFTALIP